MGRVQCTPRNSISPQPIQFFPLPTTPLPSTLESRVSSAFQKAKRTWNRHLGRQDIAGDDAGTLRKHGYIVARRTTETKEVQKKVPRRNSAASLLPPPKLQPLLRFRLSPQTPRPSETRLVRRRPPGKVSYSASRTRFSELIQLYWSR
jgi:hypothetical protein